MNYLFRQRCAGESGYFCQELASFQQIVSTGHGVCFVVTNLSKVLPDFG